MLQKGHNHCILTIWKRGGTMNMGQKIYALRKEKGMTLEELGDKVGVGKSTVRKWENGMIANMKRDKILKISEVLGVSPGYLMGWEDPIATQQDNFSLSNIEKEIVTEYRKADDITKAMVLRALSIDEAATPKRKEELRA